MILTRFSPRLLEISHQQLARFSAKLGKGGRKRALPLFENEDELFKYLTSVFGVVKFSEGTARKAAEVKAAGDEMLKRAPNPSLRARRLSACDAFTIAVALDRALPVLSGDKDLVYVASGLGVRVIW